MVSAHGVYTEEEFRNGIMMTTNDRRFRADARVLIDFTGVTELKISADAVSEFVKKQVFLPQARRAFVVKSGFEASFVEVGKLFGTVEQVQVFRDRGAAVSWLNERVPPEKAVV